MFHGLAEIDQQAEDDGDIAEERRQDGGPQQGAVTLEVEDVDGGRRSTNPPAARATPARTSKPIHRPHGVRSLSDRRQIRDPGR